MIKNIQFKDSNGYLTSTIDGQTLSLEVKEIIREEVDILNYAQTSIPLYEKIPINIEFQAEDEIETGEIEISIVSMSQDNKIINTYYNENKTFINNKFEDLLEIDIPLGLYYVIITYKGSKYFKPSSLTYLLTIEKRKALYDFESDYYYGNPLETINIKFKIYDSITEEPLSNFMVYYEYQGITYIAKSNINGYISLNLIIPEEQNSCINNNNRKYPIDIYINHESYYASNVSIYTYNNKLPTEIMMTSQIESNGILLNGNIVSNNYDDIKNVKHGFVSLSVENEEYSIYNIKPEDNGNFEFIINMNDVEDNFANTEQYMVYEFNKDINVSVTINTINNINVQEKIYPHVTVKTIKNNKPILYGMVLFELIKSDKVLQSKIIEIDNGEADTEFYLSTKGSYKVRCSYYNVFEYKDNDRYHIVNFKVE